MSFSTQVAVITGGAGGIGFETACKLAAEGSRVCVVDLKQSALDEAQVRLEQEVPSHSGTMMFACDAAADDSAERCVAAVIAKWGRLDVLVQAAGITGKTGITTDVVDPADFDSVLRINLRAIFLFCRAALRIMKTQRYGRIVNIASIAGKEGNAGMLAYSASKAAVIGLTKSIGKEFADGHGDITCNAIAPAVVRTAMVAAMPDHQVKYMTDRIPMKRTGTLDEITSLILFVASKPCSFTTGFCFDATGGRSTY